MTDLEQRLANFKAALPDSERARFELTTVGEVWSEIRKIQQDQEKKGMLRYMRRLHPFLEALERYSKVVEVFVSAKPDLLAFIWGPVKLLIQIGKSHVEAFDALLNAMREIGDALPRFTSFEATFEKNPRVSEVIQWLYEDILDFFTKALNFYRTKSRIQLFKTIRPAFEDQLDFIIERLQRHARLVDSEAQAADFVEAANFRKHAYKEFENQQEHRQEQQLLSLRTWLSPYLTPESDLDRLGTTAAECPATGQWLLDYAGFKNWLTNGQILWLSGIPGSGKTILSYKALQYLESNCANPSFGIFLTHENREHQTAVSVLRSIIYHFAGKYPLVLNTIKELRETPTRTRSIAELEELLKQLLSIAGGEACVLVLDGLDEIEELQRELLLRSLYDLAENKKIRLLLSCRDLPEIRKKLSGVPVITISHENGDDIRIYAESKVNSLAESFPLLGRSEVSEVLRRVAIKAEGMFLYARLVISILRFQHNSHSFREAANRLPTGLDEAYKTILDWLKIRPEHTKHVTRSILEYMCSSKGTVRRLELERVLLIDEKDDSFTLEKVFERAREISELCGPIVEWRERTDTVHFVHFTVKEYLLSTESGPFLLMSEADYGMAIRCASFLCFRACDPKLTDYEIECYVSQGDYCWFTYAQSYWLKHLKSGCKSGATDIGKLQTILSKFFERWQGGISVIEDSSKNHIDFGFGAFKAQTPDLYNLLNHAALQESIGDRRLKSSVPNENPEPALPGTLSLREFSQRVQQILESVYDRFPASEKSRLDVYYGKNIFRCTKNFCLRAMDGFESRGERDAHVARYHERPFKCEVEACYYAKIGFSTESAFANHIILHKETEAIEKGLSVMKIADKTAQTMSSDYIHEILLRGVKENNISAVQLVLESGGMPYDPSSSIGSCPLLQAIARDHIELVQLFCLKGAPVNGELWNRSCSPLHVGAYFNSKRVVQFLLQHGADVNSPTRGSFTYPLHLAVHRNSVECARLLLENGSIVDIKDRWDSTPLHFTTDFTVARVGKKIAGIRSQAEIVNLLLHHGADVNTVDRQHKTPLHVISDSQRKSSKQIRKINIFEVDVEDGPPTQPLIHLTSARAEVAQILLANGANVDATDSNGCTLLYNAVCMRNCGKLVKLLLDKGANLKVTLKGKEKKDIHILHRAITDGTVDSVRLLLEHGSRVDSEKSTDATPSTAVIWLAKTIWVFKVEKYVDQLLPLLLEYGANINACDSNGKTSLFHAGHAAYFGFFKPACLLMKGLMEAGADHEVKPKDGSNLNIHAQFEEYTGVSWEDLVKQTNEQREKVKASRTDPLGLAGPSTQAREVQDDGPHSLAGSSTQACEVSDYGPLWSSADEIFEFSSLEEDVMNKDMNGTTHTS